MKETEMDDIEREAVFCVANMSGYTRFIFSNEKDISHSQMVGNLQGRSSANRGSGLRYQGHYLPRSKVPRPRIVVCSCSARLHDEP